MLDRSFSFSSAENLARVHPNLIAVAALALTKSTYEFAIVKGQTGLEHTRRLFGESETDEMRCRHSSGHAIDIIVIGPQGISREFQHYEEVAEAFIEASIWINIPIKWGGHRSSVYGPHFQLA